MKVFSIIMFILFAFLLIPIHYLAILPLLKAFALPRLLLILLVSLSFLGAIFTAGYNK